MRVILVLFTALLAVCLLAGTGLYLASPIEPASWLPSPDPGLTGVYRQNTRLTSARRVLAGAGTGPEDIALGPDGLFYTGVEDGRILRFDRGGAWTVYADTGGRPLGMQFDSKGDLIVADGRLGLIAVSSGGDVRILADSAAGQPILFADDLDIAADGSVWFSDASMRHAFGSDMLDMLEAVPSGRLLRYAPDSGEVTVELDGLWFANGVALGPDDTFVLVAETFNAVIHRLWLKGERAGQFEAFNSGLPGYPDNISYNGDGRFWVALPAVRQAGLERLAGWPFLRRIIAALPARLRAPDVSYGMIIALDVDGNPVDSLHAPGGEVWAVTSVNQYGSDLLLGSYLMPSAAILALQ